MTARDHEDELYARAIVPTREYRMEAYRRALADPPPRGAGMGHSWLLATANRAALAGVDAVQAAQDLADARPGKPAREYREAIAKAYAGRGNAGTWTPAPRRTAPDIDAAGIWRRALAKAQGLEVFPEIWERSPVPLHDDVDNDAALLLSTLYAPDEFVYIGGAQEPGIIGGNVRTVRGWLAHFAQGGKPGPHIIPNPLSGQPAPTKDGKESLRCDAAVSALRYAVVEFDAVPKHEQAAFWLSARLPVACLLDSGGKSLHAWIRVDVTDAAQWERELRPELKRLLQPLGADPACWNPARLSRCPGVPRGDDWQRVLFLDPEARGLAR